MASTERMTENDFRLATWNIASNKELEAVVSTIADLNIDVCALQEVSLDPDADLPPVLNRAKPIFRDYNLHYSSTLSPVELGGGRPEYYGLGVVSKHPLRHVLSFQLGPRSTAPLGDAEQEPRILQVAMPLTGPPIIFANTHLAATQDLSLSETRRSQVTRIVNILRPLVGPVPIILGGDFNTIPSSADLAGLRAVLPYTYEGSEATYVADVDRATIDFFCSSVPLDIAIQVAPVNDLSDHNIVVATLRGWTRGRQLNASGDAEKARNSA
jgi:endonuclease/exonuclease/phosphatase family metal-dependent hydrolase